MLRIKNIFKTLFILTIIISSLNVYGTDLKYRANFVNVNNSDDYTCDIATPVQPYSSTIEEYDRRIANGESIGDGWLPGSGDNRNTYGTESTFSSFNYVFHPKTKYFSTYNSGWVSSGSSNNIFYDSYSGFIGFDFDSINDFSGVKVNIPENQDDRTDGYMTISKTDPNYVSHVKWKVINNVVIDVYRLKDALVDDLLGTFDAATLSSTGIRFSNVLRTKYSRNPGSYISEHKSYMDTAWVYFQCTVGYWNSGGRGFQEDDVWNSYGTGTYKKGSSVANEFDNILVIPVADKTQIEREVYINHVDEDGNILPGFENSSLNLVDTSGKVVGTRNNTGPKDIYKEYYQISGDEGIAVKKSSVTHIGEMKYEFQRGESGVGTTLSLAKHNFSISKKQWSLPYTFRTTATTTKTNDVVVVNLVYKKIPPPKQELPNLEIIGRLAFINTSSEYSGSTSGTDLDYIPSTKQLTPYADGAYPYVVRALRYEKNAASNTVTATVQVTQPYSWQYWVFEHHDKQVCVTTTGADGKSSTSCHDECTAACKYYSYTSSSSKSRTFSYTVPYKHTWYKIVNFKLYRISKLEVYDKDDDLGGILFANGGGTYTVNPSGTYESRFNSSRGKIDKTLIVTFPSESYSMSNIHKSASSPGSGQSSASSAAQSALDALTAKIAADHENLTVTYQYDNDYVELDGTTNMLQRNYKTWSEHIYKESDTYTRDLDSTKTGSGQVNGSDLSYTSNLMSFMRPSSRLTTNSDFAPNYQTVPVDRENGIRRLSGRIYYSISTDGKYNVGGETFTSTDATYQLNKLINLTGLDFINYDKLYERNDVNRVNVLTPVNFGNFELITDKKVDHSTATSGAGSYTILQKNAEFSITPAINGTSTAGYSLGDTREFVKGYYFVFDFNVILSDGTLLPALQPIYVAGRNATLRAKTTDSFGSASADQLTNSVKIVAITTNVTNALKSFYDSSSFSATKYMDPGNNMVRNTNMQNEKDLLTRSDVASDTYHAIYKRINTKNIGRLFDFAVTDCTDLAFKDIFKTTSSGNINTPTGISYYSGYKKWNLYSNEYNEMINRTDIGSNPQLTLPLGPYKNTNTRYINAPKMGYRISFDLKTTGFMAANNANNTRRIEITPSYYYISKDGKTFDNNIKLYFKNSNGSYVNFASSGYTIYYKPNDGYRYLRNSIYTDNYTMMSSKLEPLTVSSKIILNSKSMSMNNTSFIQAWYGEFKLPNSTIAVSNVVGSPNNNVNNPYKDGYIGVIFDIKCIDSAGFTLSYNQDDHSASPSNNTSQWDYEGFMNFKTPGSATNTLRYQLEKDIWEINEVMYDKIKGTVALFDIDNRAANDFE